MATQRSSNGSDRQEMGRLVDRLPPFNPEAEESVLGSLLMDPMAIHSIPFLRPEHFYRERNGTIFKLAQAVTRDDAPVDFTTLSDKLREQGVFDEVGGLAYLSHLVSVVPTAVHIEHYARIVERLAVRRRGISAGGKIAALMYDETITLEDAIARCVETLGSAIVSDGQRPVYSPDALAELFLNEAMRLAEAREEGLGLMTGTRIDYFLRGLKPGNVYVVAARPGMGKSTLVQGFARKFARKDGKKVFLATAEMTALQLAWREAAYELRMDAGELERRIASGDPDSHALVHQVVTALAKTGVHIFDASGMTAMEIRAKAARMQQTEGLDVIIIDYLQRLADASSDQDENDVRAISKVSGNVCDMAKALGVPVILVSQLSRACESRPDKRPILSDLRGSGALEQDAYGVLFIYRDEKYNKNTSEAGVAEIILAKNRGGRDGIIMRFSWRPDVQDYADYEPEHEDQPPAIETIAQMRERRKGR